MNIYKKKNKNKKQRRRVWKWLENVLCICKYSYFQNEQLVEKGIYIIQKNLEVGRWKHKNRKRSQKQRLTVKRWLRRDALANVKRN